MAIKRRQPPSLAEEIKVVEEGGQGLHVCLNSCPAGVQPK